MPLHLVRTRGDQRLDREVEKLRTFAFDQKMTLPLPSSANTHNSPAPRSTKDDQWEEVPDIHWTAIRDVFRLSIISCVY